MLRGSIRAVLAAVTATVLITPVVSGAQGWHATGEPGTGSGVGRSTPAAPAARPPMFASPSPVAPQAPQGFPAAPPGFPGAFPFAQRPTDRSGFHRPPFNRSGVVYAAPPVIYYGAPGTLDYGSAPLYDPSTAYDPSLGYGGQQTAAAMPSVIEYPTGRYELRGNGSSAPYTWVWIPNPPPPPPMAEPAPPRVAEPAAPPADARAAGHSTVYRWIDSEGVVHFTDSLDSVPPEHRSKIKPPPSS